MGPAAQGPSARPERGTDVRCGLDAEPVRGKETARRSEGPAGVPSSEDAQTKKLRYALLIAAALSASLLSAADLKVTLVDIGQGDAIHIQTPSGKNYLIDGGDTSDPNTPPALDDATQDF